jgi:hypothetical protein
MYHAAAHRSIREIFIPHDTETAKRSGRTVPKLPAEPASSERKYEYRGTD